MNKKIYLVSALFIFLLTGCQDKVSIQSPNGDIIIEGDGEDATYTYTDSHGDTSTITGNTGRPADAPADLPSPAGAYDFNFYDSVTFSSLSYMVKGTSADLRNICDEIKTELENVGWTVDNQSMHSEDDGNILRAYQNSEYKLNQMCSLSDGVPDIALMKSKKQ